MPLRTHSRITAQAQPNALKDQTVSYAKDAATSTEVCCSQTPSRSIPKAQSRAIGSYPIQLLSCNWKLSISSHLQKSRNLPRQYRSNQKHKVVSHSLFLKTYLNMLKNILRTSVFRKGKSHISKIRLRKSVVFQKRPGRRQFYTPRAARQPSKILPQAQIRKVESF